MPASSEWTLSPPHTPSPTRRILSKIATPFGNKNRNISDFYVQAEDPHRRYSQGDVVKGSVILKLAKPIRITHIVVALHGFVQVYKTPGTPPPDGFRASNSLIGRGGGRKRGEYFGNGFATLFEDEIVLCGEGRLANSFYKFEFELVFPDEEMPSSIDFERGTISYMVTATMTRPQAIAPITFHDQKIFYTQSVDVAPFLPPKPRTITLEPLPGRSRARKTPKATDPIKNDEAQSERSTTPSMPPNPLSEANLPSTSSDTQSVDSRPSSNCATSTSESLFPVSIATDSKSALDVHSPNQKRTRAITATVESLKGGCLRGEHVPLKVAVTHNKPIKSIYGIIVTLYRQARVDMHPVIPLGPTTEGQKKRYEDYYPKSITGLGGLSLSGAGSSHVFRKDLVQVVMPLLVDPQTLMAEVNVKVGMPEDVFPTISTVPGGMIAFQYYIEVILDIRGKLAGQDRLSSQTNGMSSSGNQQGAFQDMVGYPTGGRSGHHLYGQAIIDTAPIRRDRNVVMCVLEVVVGTKDSERTRAKGKERLIERDESYARGPQESIRSLTTDKISTHTGAGTMAGPSVPNHRTLRDEHALAIPEYLHDPQDRERPHHQDSPDHDHRDYEYFAPPEVSEEGLTEKEQLQRAEALLLPSQPPEADYDLGTATPSAPVLEYEGGYGNDGLAPAYLHSADDDASPGYGYHSSGQSLGPSQLFNDKAELRRQQLESEASAPLATWATEETVDCAQDIDAPSFPHEDDLYNGSYNGSEPPSWDHLPRYER